MRRICHNDLKMSPYMLQKRQLISANILVIEKRLAKSKLLLKRLKNGTLQNLSFTDEKLFTVQQAHNHQNDRVLAKTLNSIPANTKKVFRTQKPASVMVWTAISEKGKSSLVFVNSGVKINKELYIKDILEGALIPWCKSLNGEDN